MQFLRTCPSEAYFWIVALVGVASINPEAPPLLNLCLFENLGVPCPGDGLGQSIAYLARGQFDASWAAHPLGAPVVGVLGYHVGRLLHSTQTRAQA
jgi:hypothetical protein